MSDFVFRLGKTPPDEIALVYEALNNSARITRGLHDTIRERDAEIKRLRARIARLEEVSRQSSARAWRRAELLRRALAHIEVTQSLWKEIQQEVDPPPTTPIDEGADDAG